MRGIDGSGGSHSGVESSGVDVGGVSVGAVEVCGRKLVDGAPLVVPGVAAVRPGQNLPHGHEQVVEGPGDDDVVVDADNARDDDHAVAHTLMREVHTIKLVSG